VAVIFTELALSWSRGPLAAALLPTAALWPLDATWRRSKTTGHPPWMGRPPLPGLRPARCLQGGRHHHASSVRRLGGQQRSNAGEGGKARVFECTIGVQSELSSTHAHLTCASSPRTSCVLLGNRPAPSPPPEMPMVTTALFAVTFNYQGTVAETETFTKSRERTSPTCGTSTD